MNLQPLRYAISDRNFARSQGWASVVDQARRLGLEGVDFFQLREKDLDAGELASMAREILAALAGSPTRLLINSRTDVAVATGAHGVHLTSSPDELRVQQVHRLYAETGLPAPLVTLSCHSLEDVARACREPLTAILFGPVFGKTVAGEHVLEGSGLALLEEACRLAAPLPLMALGGVTEENAAACLETGAAGVAGIRLFQRTQR